jgi:uncharacterized membrane protein
MRERVPAMTNTGNERRGGTAVLNINTVIQNPVFFLGFMGALSLTALAGWRLRGSAGTGAPASLRGAGVLVPGVAAVRP